MKHLQKKYVVLVILVVIAATIAAPTLIETQENQQNPIVGPNYLYIEEFEIAQGVVPNEAIAELKGWVKIHRESGEFKSARLFIHNTGPRFALYVLLEPNSWQSLENGFNKLLAALPDFMDTPHKFGAHSDNLLSEIPVE